MCNLFNSKTKVNSLVSLFINISPCVYLNDIKELIYDFSIRLRRINLPQIESNKKSIKSKTKEKSIKKSSKKKPPNLEEELL